MEKGERICRVCGKKYEYCHTFARVKGVFRWQDVACSPACGEIYLRQIIESRAEKPEPKEDPEGTALDSAIINDDVSPAVYNENIEIEHKKRSRGRRGHIELVDEALSDDVEE